MTRHLDFDGIANFRDFGGYATAGGGRIHRGRFFRSASHHWASDSDLERLSGLGLSVIVDLRQPSEREREPSRRWPGFAVEVVQNEQAEQLVDFHGQLKTSDLSAAWFFDHAIDFYGRAPYEPRHVDLFRRYFHALAASEGGMLVHCAAGKDRTGLICALTHHIAGVHRDDMVEDYLLTNEVAARPERIAGARIWLERVHGGRPSDEACRVVISVHPSYLETAFSAIEARHGSIDAYLQDMLGMDPALRARVRDRLLA